MKINMKPEYFSHSMPVGFHTLASENLCERLSQQTQVADWESEVRRGWQFGAWKLG